MAATTGQLGLVTPTQGTLTGTWGDTVNNGITEYTNIAIAGTLTLTGDGAVTLANTTGDNSASNITSTLAGAGTVTAQFATVRVSGTTTTKVVTGPSYSKSYLVDNASSYAVTFKASGQTGVSISPGEKVYVYYNATDYVKVGGGGITYGAVKTTTYTAVANDGVLTNTTSAAFTVNLPASPATGTQVFIADSAGTWATNNLTIGRNGSTIAGSATDLVCDINSVSIQCIYDGTTWDIFAQIGANDTAVVTLNGTQTLTNKTLTSPTITGTGAIAAATVTLSSTLSVTGVSTLTGGAVVQGLTVGRGAGAVSTNTAVGASALAANGTARYNTAIGYTALTANTSGESNTAVGMQALLTNTTGGNNIAVGQGAVGLNTTGSNNTGIGFNALVNNTTASNNTAVGYQAAYSNTTGSLTAVGRFALYSNTTGTNNTSLGYNSAASVTTGSFNTSIGDTALYNTTTASNNTAVGYQAGYNIVTSAGNVCLGYQNAYSLSSSGVGNYVTTIGYQAFYYGLGDGNVAIGRNSQYGVSGSTNGSVNVSVGNNSLKSITSASGCVAIGNDALGLNTSGSNHVAVGYQALYNNTGAGQGSVGLGYYAGGTLTSGTNGVFIGYNAQPNAATDTNELVVGTPNTTGKGSNTGFIVAYNGSTYGGIYQGNNSASWSTTSDQRIKKNVVDVSSGLSVITALRPVEFDYKENDKHEVGFIAQEFQQILPNQIIHHAPNEAEKEWVDDEVMGIQPNLVPYLVKAIQEQQAIITQLTERITALEA